MLSKGMCKRDIIREIEGGFKTCYITQNVYYIVDNKNQNVYYIDL